MQAVHRIHHTMSGDVQNPGAGSFPFEGTLVCISPHQDNAVAGPVESGDTLRLFRQHRNTRHFPARRIRQDQQLPGRGTIQAAARLITQKSDGVRPGNTGGFNPVVACGIGQCLKRQAPEGTVGNQPDVRLALEFTRRRPQQEVKQRARFNPIGGIPSFQHAAIAFGTTRCVCPRKRDAMHRDIGAGGVFACRDYKFQKLILAGLKLDDGRIGSLHQASQIFFADHRRIAAPRP